VVQLVEHPDLEEKRAKTAVTERIPASMARGYTAKLFCGTAPRRFAAAQCRGTVPWHSAALPCHGETLRCNSV
jgi:hypothetical protein